LVEIRSVTAEIRRQRKKKEEIKKENIAVKYNPFRIVMPGWLIRKDMIIY